MSRKPAGPLRRGWTTGACATAATKAAFAALLTGRFPDPVEIVLPKGERPSFPLARAELQSGVAASEMPEQLSKVSPLAKGDPATAVRAPVAGVIRNTLIVWSPRTSVERSDALSKHPVLSFRRFANHSC